MAGPRGGEPALYGKNIARRRKVDNWSYKFNIAGRIYRGRCGTKDKQSAEAMAAQLKQKIRYEIQTVRDAALAAIANGEPFILLLPGREGSRYISNIDQRDIVILMKEQIARLDGKEASDARSGTGTEYITCSR